MTRSLFCVHHMIFVLALVACGSGAKTAPGPDPGASAAKDGRDCPVAVPGTSVTVEDTDTGAALVFVTTGDLVELRRRVAAMVAMHNEHHAKMGPMPTGAAPAGEHAGHDKAGMDHGDGKGMAGMDHGGGMMDIHSQATAEDIDGGARLVLVVSPEDVTKLREGLRQHAEQMASGTCSMSH